MRGLTALGVDTEIAARNFSISLFILSRKIIPRNIAGGSSGDVNLYFASPTGWEDNSISLNMDQLIEYREFLDLIHEYSIFHVQDPFWVSWCRQFQRIGHVTTGSCLRVYLCPSSDFADYMAHAVAACLCINPDDNPNAVGAVLLEILWWGLHRHVALRDWHPQLLRDKGWLLLVIPTIPDLIFPDLSPEIQG